MEKTQYLTVSSLTNYIKYKFDSDKNLRKIYIKGEISNFKKHSSGHMYFSLKDEKSKINAIMFGANARKLNFNPSEGSKVLALGRITVFESTGAYQIYIDEMIEDGIGNLYVAFEKLKKDLMKEGLFDSSKKKQIPKFPRRVGVITAPTGAAIRDVISTIRRRSRITEIIVIPALVQGEQAAKDIANKIMIAKNYNLDVLIVGRGGGSIEDLWPFNEEIVARAIFNCPIPIISGTGHETDTTIADYVADLRAPTPTGAAEIAVPNLNEIITYIDQIKLRCNKSIIKKIEHNSLILDKCMNSFVIKNPVIMYENKKQQLDIINEKLKNLLNYKLEKNKNFVFNIKQNLTYLTPSKKIMDKVNLLRNIEEKLNKNIEYKLEFNIQKFNSIIDKIEILNPIGVLKRGYSIVYKNNVSVNNYDDVNKGDKLNIKLHKGNILVNVEEKNGE